MFWPEWVCFVLTGQPDEEEEGREEKEETEAERE